MTMQYTNCVATQVVKVTTYKYKSSSQAVYHAYASSSPSFPLTI